MATLQQIHRDINFLKQEIELIKHILVEEGDLTKRARRQLAEARKTTMSSYISIDKLSPKNV